MPLTPAQEEELLKFMQDDPVYAKYYDEVVILLETGLRISGLCGLTETDLNFDLRFVNVDHQLLRSTEDGYYIETPKTDSGFRQVPMSAAAYEAFQRVLKNRKGAKAIKVDGYSNFLFLNRNGLPKVAVNYDAPHHEAHILHKDGKCRDEPQGIAVHHGTRQYRYDAELLRTRHIPIRTGGNGAAGSSQGGKRRSCCGNHRGEHGGNQGCRLVVSRYLLPFLLLPIAKT